MNQHQRPEDIVAFCLEPLDLNRHSPAAREVARRFSDAIHSLSHNTGHRGIASVDQGKSSIVINEEAHGYDA